MVKNRRRPTNDLLCLKTCCGEKGLRVPAPSLIRTSSRKTLSALVTGSVRVDGIEPSDGRALLGNGERLAYDKLLLCTGGRVRTLPFAPIGRAGVYYLRTATDALALSQAIWSARRLVIIGGGYLALEAAASAKSLGIEVTIIEMAPESFWLAPWRPTSRAM